MPAIQDRLPYLAPTPSLPPQTAYIYTFDFLAFTSLVTLAGILATAVANEKIRRSGTWYSLIVSWMVYSAGYLLILGHQTGPAPAFGICTLQAAVVYGTPTLTAYTYFCFVVDTYNALRRLIFHQKRPSKIMTRVLIVLPWALCVGNMMLSLSLVPDATSVERDQLSHMFCHIKTGVPAYITAILCILPLATALCIEAWVTFVIYKHWRSLRQAMKNDKETNISISLLIRIVFFTTVPITGISLTAAASGSGSAADSPLWTTLLGTLPMGTAIAFGTQKDIITTWFFCKRLKLKLPQPEEPEFTFDTNAWTTEVTTTISRIPQKSDPYVVYLKPENQRAGLKSVEAPRPPAKLLMPRDPVNGLTIERRDWQG